MQLTAKDIEDWADKSPQAPTVLPRLVRRLIQANNPVSLESFAFSSDKGVWLGGWDGLTTANSPSISLPAGGSGWELSTSEEPSDKASSDYRDRIANPDPVDRSKTTFVALTARVWAYKSMWAAKRRSRKPRQWSDVRAYDAEDLATWLDEAPAVAVWFEQIVTGRRALSAIDVGRWWSEFAAGTRPQLPLTLLTGDREADTAAFMDRLGQNPDLHFIHGESREEALAFFAAATLCAPNPDLREGLLAKTLIVDDERTWRELALHPKPLVLVPNFDWSPAVAEARDQGHHLVLPLGNKDEPERNEVTLGSMRTSTIGAALVAAGMPLVEAERIAHRVGGSLAALKGELAVSRNLERPEWAQAGTGPSIARALLLGAWDESREADIAVAASASQSDYQSFATNLRQVLWEHAGPVRKVGSVWRLVSIADAWRKLHRWLSSQDVLRFESLAVQVLRELDPRFDLTPDERWLAPVKGLQLQHSRHLREGIAETLAQIASIGSDLTMLDSPVTPGDLACRIVQAILNDADWKLWASLGPVLGYLAEACPSGFLAALDRDLHGNPPVIKSVFDEEHGGIAVSSPHVDILWALERVAWSTDHFAHVAHLLAELAELDPGGRLANRPLASLIGLFRLWLPQTAATPSQRLLVLDSLRRRHPEIVWPLMLAILPHRMAVAVPAAKPRFRDWPAEDAEPSASDLGLAVSNVIGLLLDDAGSTARRWKDLIDALQQLPDSVVDGMIDRISTVDESAWTDTEREAVHGQLRELITQHRRFPTAGWAWSPERINRLVPIADRLAPRDPMIRWRWLFTSHPNVAIADPFDHDLYERELAQERLSALRAIGRDRVFDLAVAVEAPWAVGLALADLAKSWKLRAPALLNRAFAEQSAPLEQLARGFLVRGASTHGNIWLERILQSRTAASWPADWRAQLLVLLPFNKETWAQVDAEGEELTTLYWGNVSYLGHGPLDRETVDSVAIRLLGAAAITRAIDFLALYRDTASTQLELDTLLFAVGTPQANVPWQNIAHEVFGLLDRLQRDPQIDQDQVAMLEWQLVPFIDVGQYQPNALFSKLARDPGFFVELLELIYRAEGDEPRRQMDARAAQAASRAYELLHSWHRPPGVGGDGHPSRQSLEDWIALASKLAETSRRTKMAKEHIGQVLAYFPPDPDDNAWPHRVLRDVLEEVADPEIERGLVIGVFNSRGIVQKTLREGGQQERDLVARYTADAATVKDQWPRTAAVLRGVADGYGREAKREDEEVKMEALTDKE